MSYKSHSSIEETVKEAIERTGLPTEIKATNYLNQNNWLVKNEFPYVDEENKKVRTLDMKAIMTIYGEKASKRNAEEILECELYIECKKSSRPWVFYTEGNSYSNIEYEIDRLCEVISYEPFNTIIDGYAQKNPKVKELRNPENILSKIPRFQNIKYEVALSHQIIRLKRNEEAKPKKMDDENHEPKDEIYSAEMQILKALKYQESQDNLLESSQTKRRVIIPIILFNGIMFGCYYDKQELQTPKINYTRHLAHGLPNQKIPALIDVMTLDYFPEYLKLLKSELLLLTKD